MRDIDIYRQLCPSYLRWWFQDIPSDHQDQPGTDSWWWFQPQSFTNWTSYCWSTFYVLVGFLCSMCYVFYIVLYRCVYASQLRERRWIIHSLVILDLLIFMMNDVSFGVDSTPKYGETNWHKFMWHKHDHHDHLIQVYFNLFPIIKSDRTVLPAWYRWCIPDIFQVSR